MVWPIPTARTIASRIAGSLEAGILAVRDVDPVALSRAVRSARGVFSQIGRAVSLELREVHDHQAWWGRQYMPDTAEEEFVLRHCAIWGIERRAAIAATGTVRIEGNVGLNLASGVDLVDSTGVAYVTTSAATLNSSGYAIVPARARDGGSDGNLEAGIQLLTVSPVAGVDKITVEAAFLGGVDEQSTEDMATALLAHIRKRPQGGNGNDYQVWVREAFSVAAVAVVPDWIGRGSIALIIIMKDNDGSPRVPTDAELDAIHDYIGRPGTAGGLRPATAQVVMVKGEIQPIDITIALRPDTVQTRAAVQLAFERWVATLGDEDDEENDSPIGALIERSRISEAVSAANGEYAHDLISPVSSYRLGVKKFPIAGTVTFEGDD